MVVFSGKYRWTQEVQSDWVGYKGNRLSEGLRRDGSDKTEETEEALGKWERETMGEGLEGT